LGQVGNLRPIGNRPVALKAPLDRPIFNRRQDAILPHKAATNAHPHVGLRKILGADRKFHIASFAGA